MVDLTKRLDTLMKQKGWNARHHFGKMEAFSHSEAEVFQTPKPERLLISQ